MTRHAEPRIPVGVRRLSWDRPHRMTRRDSNKPGNSQNQSSHTRRCNSSTAEVQAGSSRCKLPAVVPAGPVPHIAVRPAGAPDSRPLPAAPARCAWRGDPGSRPALLPVLLLQLPLSWRTCRDECWKSGLCRFRRSTCKCRPTRLQERRAIAGRETLQTSRTGRDCAQATTFATRAKRSPKLSPGEEACRGSLYPRLTDCTGAEQVPGYSKVRCPAQPGRRAIGPNRPLNPRNTWTWRSRPSPVH